MRRIFYFVITNIAILAVLSISFSILSNFFDISFGGVYSGDIASTLVYAAIIGFAGAFISLAMSKPMAKRMSGARVIETPTNEEERWLMMTVQRQAEAAGIGMPEVAIFESPEVNAFATGMSRNKALVAVSRGLLNNMTRPEAEAVMAHEVSHVANGDMVTLTLVQGVVNTFVIFLARIIGSFIDKAVFKNENGPGIGYWVSVIVLEIVFGILASTIVMYFSRQREFRADEGGANLASKESMIAALERLRAQRPAQLPEQFAAFGILGVKGEGLKKLFMSHPPLEERIAALQSRI